MPDLLANVEDVETVLGRQVASEEVGRVEAILAKASALFRLHSKQEFTPGDSVSRLKVNGGRVRLPQYPAVDVRSVVDDDGSAVEYRRAGQWLTVCLGSHEHVTVDYTHGGEVPDLVRLTVAEVAKKILSIDPMAAAGASQVGETTGPYTDQITYATWAQGGQTMLAPDDLAIARSFRPRTPRMWVQSY